MVHAPDSVVSYEVLCFRLICVRACLTLKSSRDRAVGHHTLVSGLPCVSTQLNPTLLSVRQYTHALMVTVRTTPFLLIAALEPRGRLDLVGAQGGDEGARRGTLPRLARLTEAISSVLDDYTMVCDHVARAGWHVVQLEVVGQGLVKCCYYDNSLCAGTSLRLASEMYSVARIFRVNSVCVLWFLWFCWCLLSDCEVSYSCALWHGHLHAMFSRRARVHMHRDLFCVTTKLLMNTDMHSLVHAFVRRSLAALAFVVVAVLFLVSPRSRTLVRVKLEISIV